MSTIIWKSTGVANELGEEKGKSLWTQKEYKDIEESYYKRALPAKENISTDVLIIGAGMAGVLIAQALMERGKTVVVIDKNKKGGIITRNTTAKITSQHDLIYDKLLKTKGEARAREYAMSNQRAITMYKELIDKHNINCDFEVLPSYIFTLTDEAKIKKEVEAAKRLGIPSSFTKEVNIPLKIKGAVKFDNQAQFHPLKFIEGIAKKICIYENTMIKEIRDDGFVITNRGNIKASSVVIATHYPFINRPGYFFLKMHQERFYVGALKNWNKQGERLNGMYIDADPNGFSFRDYKDMLLLGTGNHRSGQTNPIDAYSKIERAKERWYSESTIEHLWSNQDCITPDSVPYIGKYSTKLPNFYVATGFNKWGMTTSMVSAMIISDMICRKYNPYRRVFYPQRLMPTGSYKIIADTAVTTINFSSEKLKITKDKIADIEKGKAGIISKDGQKIGVYRDQEDKYHYVTTKCPHLGCSLAWNPNELTWDCPCHGSRFDYYGKLINNPATRNVFDACSKHKK